MPAFRHLTSTEQLERSWIEKELIPLSEEIRSASPVRPSLTQRSLYCLFYEPSFLTRTSFERAIGLLGGISYFTEDASQFFPVKTPDFIENIVRNLAALHIDLAVVRSSDPGIIDRAASADAISIVNGGGADDHPTQALADLYTLTRELGGVDGATVAIIGRVDHRNVSALLRGLALYRDVRVLLMPFSGQADPDVVAYCEGKGLKLEKVDVSAVDQADAIYLNGPRTVNHVQLLKARNILNLHIDKAFLDRLKPGCVILDPMQRSGDFAVDAQDSRLAYYRQAENGLFVRMALLQQMLGGG